MSTGLGAADETSARVVWVQAGLVVGFVVGITVLFWLLKPTASETLTNYLMIIYGVAVLGTFGAFLIGRFRAREELQIQKQFENVVVRAEQYAAATEGDTEQQFAAAYPYGFQLWKEMNETHSALQQRPAPAVDATRDAYIDAFLAEVAVFNSIENFNWAFGGGGTFLADYTDPQFAPFIRTWREWMRSPRLRQLWVYYRPEFAPASRRLIDDLALHAWEPWPY